MAFVPLISGVCSIVGTFEMTSKPTKTASAKTVSSVIRSMLTPSPRAEPRTASDCACTAVPRPRVGSRTALLAGQRRDARVHDQAVVRHERVAHDFVVHVEH